MTERISLETSEITRPSVDDTGELYQINDDITKSVNSSSIESDIVSQGTNASVLSSQSSSISEETKSDSSIMTEDNIIRVTRYLLHK